MMVMQKNNKPLFSQHYLDHRIQACSEWQFDVTAKFDALQSLYLSRQFKDEMQHLEIFAKRDS